MGDGGVGKGLEGMKEVGEGGDEKEEKQLDDHFWPTVALSSPAFVFDFEREFFLSHQILVVVILKNY